MRCIAWTLVVVLVGSVSASIALAATVVAVVQKRRAFADQQLEIRTGDTLRFLNEDTFIHHVFVNSATMTYNSDEQEPGQSVEVRFPIPGTFLVRCQIHPKMALRVDVR